MTTHDKITENLEILRKQTGLNYGYDAHGIPCRYNLVLINKSTHGQKDISHRMPKKEFMYFIYDLLDNLRMVREGDSDYEL